MNRKRRFCNIHRKRKGEFVMKKLVAMACLFILAACGNSDYETAMKQGKISLENEDMKTATASFERALEEKPDDAEAKGYYEQLAALNGVKEAIAEHRWEAALSTALVLLQEEGLENHVKNQLDQLIETAEAELQKEQQENIVEEEALSAASEKAIFLKKLEDVEKSLASQRKILETGTQVDMTKAQGEIFESWDDALNEIYRKLEKTLPQKEMNSLREEQRKWIIYRDETATKESLPYEGGSMQSLQYLSTQANLTEKRCYELVDGYMD